MGPNLKLPPSFHSSNVYKSSCDTSHFLYQKQTWKKRRRKNLSQSNPYTCTCHSLSVSFQYIKSIKENKVLAETEAEYLFLVLKQFKWDKRPLVLETKMGLKANMFMFLLLFSWLCSATASVTYDSRAILINGKRRILISGSIHYPRSTPEVLPIMPLWFTGFLLFVSCLTIGLLMVVIVVLAF